MKRSLLLLALALALASPVDPFFAPPAAAANPVSPAEKDAWLGKIRGARERLERARTDAAQAETDYARARTRRRLRGEKKAELIDRFADSSTALIEAEEALDAMLESARRAGVPPGWVREALEGFEQSPASRR